MTNQTERLIIGINQYLIKTGIKKVLVTLSGGPDSILLAFLLRHSECEILALHCNFKLRGEESDRDQYFVEEFCRANRLPLRMKQFNVNRFIEENPGKSVEMACRELRYSWFHEIKEMDNYDRIATGHNADDNIETFFLNMLRGSGTRGLKGMEADNGEIWRPLLSLHRDDILRLLLSNSLDYITDSSNLESDFRRNFLRNEVFPLLRSRWPGFNSAMDTTLAHIKKENRIIEEILSLSIPPEGSPLVEETIMKFPDPELLVRRYIDNLMPFKTTSAEILAAIKAAKPHERIWRLRNGSVVLRNGRLYLKPDINR